MKFNAFYSYVLNVQHSTFRSTSPDVILTGPSRPPTTYPVQPRTIVSAPHTLPPMPMPSLISPPTTALPPTSLAPAFSLDSPDVISVGRATLIKPSYFAHPPLNSAHGASSAPTGSLAPPTASVQPSHGLPFSQHFPSSPPVSLSQPMQFSGSLSKGAVREALNRLVKVKIFGGLRIHGCFGIDTFVVKFFLVKFKLNLCLENSIL